MSGIIERAAAGELPEWACVSADRRAHIARVATLMTDWARELAPEETALWVAAAWLHDALRDAAPAELRKMLWNQFGDWPDTLLHGPAVAQRVRTEQPDTSPALLDAITFHTVGHERFGQLGHALYVADFLEPGRNFENQRRAAQRARMPNQLPAVVREVAAARITHLLERGSPIRLETASFWNSIVSG